jgi:hypothetical protein
MRLKGAHQALDSDCFGILWFEIGIRLAAFIVCNECPRNTYLECARSAPRASVIPDGQSTANITAEAREQKPNFNDFAALPFCQDDEG